MPSPDAPLTGGCACGAVRFEITAPFSSAGYCHCKRCQRRSGALWALNGVVDAGAFRIVNGADAVRTWRPPDGLPKSFCGECGGHVFAGDPDSGPTVGIRLGAVDGDPEVRPRWHQWVDSAPDWEPIPDDGLRRYPGQRESD
jgi:hypothetical protein